MPTSATRLLSALFIAAMVAVLPGSDPARAAEVEPAAGPPRPAGLKRLAPDADVWIDPAAKAVVVGCSVAIDRGPIEYFACTKGTKEHESVVAARSPASLVHAALLAVGLVPGKPVSFQPEYVPASGPVVRVTMRWRDEDGSVREAAGQDWIRDTRTGGRMREDWVFAGSSFWKDPTDGTEHYQADGGDLICVSNFPTATLDIPVESSQSNDALLFEAFAGRVPPSGTPVDMVLSAAPAPAP